MEKNTQQPVAWLVERHAFRASPHGQDADGHDCLEVTNEGEPKAFPVFVAQPVPRDVLMAFGTAVHDAAINAAGDNKNPSPLYGVMNIDLAAIADRYASKVQPEPVNRQLLDEWVDAYKSFIGAFDTPISRRRNMDEFSVDARARLRKFDKIIRTIADAEAAQPVVPVKWPNGCDKEVPAALRYLADHDRPYGGEQRFNFAHLYQLADEIECMAQQPLYAQQPASAKTVAVPKIDESND